MAVGARQANTGWRRQAAVAGATLLLLLGALLLTAVPPVYEVRLNDRAVGTGRDLTLLSAALEQQVRAELDRTVTLQSGGLTWTYSLKELGMEASPEQMAGLLRQSSAQVAWYQRLPWRHAALNLDLKVNWNEGRMADALAPVREALYREPAPARLDVTAGAPAITPEVNGVAVDMRALMDGLQGLKGSTQLDVPLTEQQPAVTRASLEAMRVSHLIAEWSTQYDPTIPRADNVERAARAFNGLLLKPGEIMSYNAVVGPVDAANGWKEAYVIVAGELVPGVGGGVCQVATTLYGAALRANLDILERHPHQLAVAYIAPSQDAAIAQGYEDLKIRNTTLGHLYIETEAGGGRVTFRLYGEVPEGQRVAIESKVIDSRPFETRTVVDPSLAPGREVVKVPGNRGLVSEGYRLVYMNGQLVKRELLSRDSYLPTAQVVVQGPPAPAPRADEGAKPIAVPPAEPAPPAPVEPAPTDPTNSTTTANSHP